jgi:uncharacterized protein (TIGR02594 family)
MRRFLAALFLCLIAMGVAEAKPRRHVEIQKVECSDPNGHYRCGGGDFTGRNWDWSGENWDSPKARTSSHHPNSGVKGKRRTREPMTSREVVQHSFGADLVREARRHLGQGAAALGLRRTLWCGAFMDLVLRRTGHRPGGNLARDYASYGTRVSGPQVGAIAVMARKGGGHVGVVSGIDGNGNPIIISGNHGHRVAESVYSRRRVYAYVMP